MEERKFDDLKTLINHQKAKHSKYDAFFFESRSLAACQSEAVLKTQQEYIHLSTARGTCSQSSRLTLSACAVAPERYLVILIYQIR